MPRNKMLPKITKRPISCSAIDTGLLKTGVDQANIPSLLMCLVQMTGDRKWLDDPYKPRRGRGLDDNDSAGLEQDLQDEIREAAFAAIMAWLDGKDMALPVPDNKELEHMLSVAMAEDIPEGYGEILAFNMQLEPETRGPEIQRPVDAIIIGAGVSGICAAVQLQKMGINTRIFEKNEEFGGTWWENRYPGCGVDTPNLTYTFSFRDADWSRYFPLQEEISAYFKETAEEFDLYKVTEFETTVKSANWLEDRAKWHVVVERADGSIADHYADIVFSAVGILNTPMIPEIKGMENFKGRVVHTSDWPENFNEDIEGKRVAVIGNGASAMQVVPELARKASQLTVFARSKQWAAPFPQFRKKVPEGVRYLIRAVPLYKAWYEQRLTWTFNDRVHGTLFRDPDWHDPQRSINAINDGHREYFTKYVIEELGDRQDLLKHVLPDYPPFAKRMLLDNGWYRTLTKDNVSLIPQRLAEVRGSSLIAADGQEVDVDTIVLATGFKAAEVLGSYDVTGRDGRRLEEYWEGDNAKAYLGTVVPGFPNFFILLGPNVGSGHGGSMIRSIENQTHYAISILATMFEKGAGQVEVREKVYESYNDKIDEAHAKLVWTHPGTENWYRNSRGRVVAITPWRNDAFWRMTREADPADFIFHTVTRCIAKSG